MLKVFDTEEQLAEKLAREMKEQLRAEENPVFCLASGSTPAQTYRRFAGDAETLQYIRKLKIVSLDEWVGVGREVDGSCYQMLYRDLFRYLPLEDDQICFFETLQENLEAECRRIDAYIQRHPITFSLMGVGMNGHIGLNEPGGAVKDHSSVVPLSETTKIIARKYFSQEQILEQGITLGLRQIMDSKRVVVVITGSHKQEIVKTIFQGGSDDRLPVQELLGRENIDFYLDKKAYLLAEDNRA